MKEKKPLTYKQRLVLVSFNLMESSIFPKIGVRPHDLGIAMGHNESAPIYGALTALVKKGYIEKVPNTKGKKTLYRTIPNEPVNFNFKSNIKNDN